jgi:D-alanine-D-alanine ligase
VSDERLRLAVVMGGRSSEHAISLASAQSVLEALDPERYDVASIGIGHDGRWELVAGSNGALPAASVAETLPVRTASAPARLGEVDVVLPILHGPFGEVCMDKDLFKAVMRDHAIR